MREQAKKIKTQLPAIFLALKDKETPCLARIIAGITIVYALSPIDLIPDFIPVLGYLDDVILLPMLIAVTIKLIPDKVLEKNRSEAEAVWKNGKPKRWYYAIPVILLWLLVLFCFCAHFFHV